MIHIIQCSTERVDYWSIVHMRYVYFEFDIEESTHDAWLWGVFLVQRATRGHAAEMGRKINLLANNDPLFSAKTGINMGHIFKIL